MGKSRHVALLRGINVGGRHKLPMKRLVAMFEDAGATDVATYIQSGNVVFTATATVTRRIPAAVASAISKRFGFQVPVVIRTAAEMRKIVRGNPFSANVDDDKGLCVAFLADRPIAAAARSLDPNRSPPDRFVLSGRDLYLYLPNGVARTKFTNAYVDAKLSTISTVRNWRTVLKLVELTATGRQV